LLDQRLSITLRSKSLPTNKAFPITAAYIEFLHDRGISLAWPGIEPVGPFDCLNLNLLESAPQQPFQAGYGQDFYPTIYDKAACLFFSLAGGHIFANGNKRTAVLAVDQFLTANEIYLLLSNEEIKKIAEETASYRLLGKNEKVVIAELSEKFEIESMEFRIMKHHDGKLHWRWHSLKRSIRTHALNQPGIRPFQATVPRFSIFPTAL
jgi:death-on-curing family protein